MIRDHDRKEEKNETEKRFIDLESDESRFEREEEIERVVLHARFGVNRRGIKGINRNETACSGHSNVWSCDKVRPRVYHETR